MPPAPSNIIYDGISVAGLGMNDGAAGQLLSPQQAQLLVNATCRGDYIKQRPGWRKIMQVYSATDGFYQHGGWLRTRAGAVYLVAVINGRFFRVDPLTKDVMEITIPGDPNPSTLAEGWSMPGGAEGFWVYQDGQSKPFIWDGAGARRAQPGQIRTGKQMAYANSRIWYVLPDGLQYRAGDIVGNADSGDPGLLFRDSILWETENTYLAEKGNFSIPAYLGEITALSPLAQLDTSQGQGPLQVFCEKGAFSVNAPVERELWQIVKYPLVTMSLNGTGGASGQQSCVPVNSDIITRANDGIRSFVVARREFQTWANAPQSYEVSNVLKYDQEDLLRFASAAVFDNRMLMTVSPVWSEHGVFHRGLVALDLSPVTSMGKPREPVYDGIWTGVKILTILQTDIGTFMFVLDDDGTIDLWQITKDDLYDNETTRVTWNVIPRTLFVDIDPVGRPIWNLKRLETADLFYDELGGNVSFDVSWKPDQFPCWTKWKSWEECAPICSTTPDCPIPLPFHTQYQPRMRLSTPPDVCAVGSRVPLRNFYQLNLRLDITGPARLIGWRTGAIPQSEPHYDPNCDDPQCIPVRCCEFDIFSYGSSGTTTAHGSGSGSGSGSGEDDSGGSGAGGSGDSGGDGGDGGGGGDTDDGGGGGGGGGGDEPELPGVGGGPGGGFPTTDPFEGFYIFESGYGIESEAPDYPNNVTEEQAVFWGQLLENVWNASGPGTWSERHIAWYFNNHITNLAPFTVRYADGSPVNTPEDGLTEFSAPWQLVYLWKP